MGLDGRGLSFNAAFSRKSIALSASLAFLGSLAIYVLTIYSGPVQLRLGPFSFSSSHLFRPALILLACWWVAGILGVALPGRKSWGVVFVCLAAYSFPSFSPVSGDVVASEYTALSIATGKGTSLDRYPELAEDGLPYFVTSTEHGLRSSYPLGPALVAWPAYVPAAWSGLERSEFADRAGRFSAILIALAGVWLAIRIAERLDPPFSPHLLGLVYGLGTSHWSVSAAGLWQHGPGELWLLGSLERILDTESPRGRRLPAIGACLALAVFSRPVLAAPAALILLAVLQQFRRRSLLTVMGFAAIAFPLAYYNFHTYGALAGPYSHHLRDMLALPLAESMDRTFWLFFSPSRGVLWFEPVVPLTLVLASARAFSARHRRFLILGILAYGAVWATYSRWGMWWGGHCFGPRFMTDALPMWFLAVASMGPIPVRWRRAASALTGASALLVLAHQKGADIEWNERPSVDWFPERVQSLGDSQIVTSLLTMAPESKLALAQNAILRSDPENALRLLSQELSERPWNRFAAIRFTDTLVRSGELREAQLQADRFLETWPQDSYFRHLDRRLPAILRLLETKSWVEPRDARASRHPELARYVCDGSLETAWTTRRPQTGSDWLELGADPSVPIRGVSLLSVPEFGHGPSGLELVGIDGAGNRVPLGSHRWVKAPLKGWITMRFSAVRLLSLRIQLPRSHSAPWTVTEARFLATGEGSDAPTR